jgi:hypothetical protein
MPIKAETLKKVKGYNDRLGQMLERYFDKPSESTYEYIRGFTRVLYEIGVITFDERLDILAFQKGSTT